MAQPAAELASKRIALITDGLAGPCQVRMYLASVSEIKVARVLEELLDNAAEVIETTEPTGGDAKEIKTLHDALVRCLDWMTRGQAGTALTERELQCLESCAGGKTYWETGRILGISERTVIFHMQSVREKLTSATNAEAVAKAVRAGMV